MSRSLDTPELRKSLIDYLRLGNTLQGAAAACGISRETLRQYRKDPEFDEAVTKAMAHAQVTHGAVVFRSAVGGAIKRRRTYTQRDGTKVEEVEYTLPDWAAAAWYLERRFPAEWGRDRVTGRDLSELTDEELMERLRDAIADDGEAIGEPATPRLSAPVDDAQSGERVGDGSRSASDTPFSESFPLPH